MSENVQREEKIENLSDYSRLNAELASRVYNDSSLSMEKQTKLFSTLLNGQIKIRAEQRKTMLDLARVGQVANGQINALTFDPRPEN